MTINCKGQLIDLTTSKVMGILNITPDSFYDGGKYKNDKDILLQAEKILVEGASFIDVGAYSSRPGAEQVDQETELKRIIPVIELLTKHLPEAIISVDTYRSDVARHCIEAGAALINDISAGQMDENMMKTVGELGVPYIMMHIKGTPQDMQNQTSYDDLVKDIIFYFSERLAEAKSQKINDIIIDPGFGFSKTLEQNYELLNKLELIKLLGLPIMVGVSRKSMIYKLLEATPDNALNGTTALNSIALYKGATFLRVHDVKEAMECIALTNQLNS